MYLHYHIAELINHRFSFLSNSTAEYDCCTKYFEINKRDGQGNPILSAWKLRFNIIICVFHYDETDRTPVFATDLKPNVRE